MNRHRTGKPDLLPSLLMLLGILLGAAGFSGCCAPWGRASSGPIFCWVWAAVSSAILWGELIARRSVRSRPDAARALEIEQKDERNIAISNAAKAKAFDVMLAAFSPLILILALLEVDLLPLLLTVGVYLFVVFDSIYWLNRYHKEM